MRFTPPLAAVAAVLLSLSVLSGAVLAFADVGVTTSETSVDVSRAVSAANGATLDTTDGVTVVAIGDAPADRDVERAVVDALRANLVDADAAELRAAYDRPVLVVVPGERSVAWTPFGAEASAAWRYVYVQSGDLTGFGGSAPGAGDFATERLVARLTAEEGVGGVVLDDRTDFVTVGEVALADSTRGLLSLPYYERHVTSALTSGSIESFLSN